MDRSWGQSQGRRGGLWGAEAGPSRAPGLACPAKGLRGSCLGQAVSVFQECLREHGACKAPGWEGELESERERL